MNAIVLDEIVPRKGFRVAGQTLPPSTNSVGGHDDATTALALVSEAGQAIRKLESQSRDAITRATNAALAVKEKLDQTTLRADTAEAALQKAEAEISELSDIVEQADTEIKKLRAELASMEKRLAETTSRAVTAETQAEEAANSIHRIVTAIRTELPIASAAIVSA